MNQDTQTGFSLFDNEESAFQAIFQSSNEGIIVADKQGIIHLANPVSEQMFGYGPGELKGKNVDVFVPISVRHRHQAYRQIYNADPQPRSMGIGRDLHGVRKDGSHFAIEVSLSNTEIMGDLFVVAFVIDITRRKKAEEALRKSEEQLITYASELENRVQKRTEDLDETIKKLETLNTKLHVEVTERKRAQENLKELLKKEKDLNELKSRFVSMASHEFRTPLSSVLSSVNLIQKYIENGALDKTGKHINRIKNSVKNLTDILNDFLSLGKLEEGKIDRTIEEIRTKPYFEELISEIEGTLKNGQEIITNFNGIESLYSDAKVLRNIIFNLLSNAIKYSPENSPIHLTISSDDKIIEIAVKDDGMGIPEEEQGHMFERFFRAKNATNIQGTGLGLNIVKKYVELLDGTINFLSEYQKGTIFTVTLPKNSK